MKNLLLGLCSLCLVLPLSAQSAKKSGGVTCSVANTPKTAADAAYAAEHFGEAETLYTAQLAASPSEAAWEGLVQSQIELNKVTEALATAKRATDALPKSAAMLALAGDAELRAGDLDQAQADFSKARAMDFCSAEAHYGMARVLALSAMNDGALKELATAHRLAPTNAAISEALFAILPPAMHAKGLRNLLASDHSLSAGRRSHLEQEAALLEAGATCQLNGPSGVAKIDLTSLFYDGTELRDYGIHVGFGKTSVDLELDSGVDGIVLSKTDADKLKVTPAVAGQQTPPYLGYVDEMKVGGMRYGKCAVSVVPDAALANRYSLIGTDFFRDRLIHLDWNARQMTLTPYPATDAPAPGALAVDAKVPATESSWSHVFVDGPRILAPVVVEKRPVGLMLLETAYIPSMLSPAAGAQFHPATDDTLSIFGVSGDMVRIFIKERVANADRTDVVDSEGKNLPVKRVGDSMEYRLVGTAVFGVPVWTLDDTALSHAAGIEVSGIVGFPLLHQYYVDIDYRNALVNLNYDVNFRTRQQTFVSQ